MSRIESIIETMRRALPASFAVLLVGALAPAATADDWPQYRGADGTGISRESGWSSKGAAEAAWETNVGRGYSSFAISAGRLYTIGHDEEDGVDAIICLDAASGKPLWTHTVDAKLDAKYHGGGSLTTPSVDGDRVFVTNRDGKVLCLGASAGDVRWAKDLAASDGVERPTWGLAASPLVLDDTIIVNFGKVFALDKATGEKKWATSDFGHAYSTPVEFEHDGRACLAMMCGDGLVVLERSSGRKICSLNWKTKYDVNAATPIVSGNRIFISSGYNHGCALVELKGDEAKIVWENKEMRNKMAGCVLIDDHLYGFDEKILKCVDLNGNEKWAQRGLGMGALTAAGGRLIALTSEGELVVAKASPRAYQELSREKVLDGGVYWTTPVLVGGRIYCRNSLGDVVCRDHRNDAGKGTPGS